MPSGSSVIMLAHVVWATARRAPLLPYQIDTALAGMLREAAEGVDSRLLAVGVASDHVHVIGRVSPTISLSTFVQRLKGRSSFELNRGQLLAHCVVWQDGFWAESIGKANLRRVEQYVLSQRHRHQDGLATETWDRARVRNDDNHAAPRRRMAAGHLPQESADLRQRIEPAPVRA